MRFVAQYVYKEFGDLMLTINTRGNKKEKK